MTAPNSKFIEDSMSFQANLAKGMAQAGKLGEIRVGQTPKDAILHVDNLTLYRYRPTSRRTSQAQPILIIYALVNRPYITDLYEKRSLVRNLLDQGLEVYLIDWGYPSAADHYLDLHHYVEQYIDQCVDAVRQDSKTDRVNILGICQGGSMSLCYIALNPDKVQNFIAMVTPVDFATSDNTLARWFADIDVDVLIDAVGNVPGMMLNNMFLSLKPFQLNAGKYLDMVKIMGDSEKFENFMRMEKWIFDSPDQAGAMFRTFIKEFFHDNKLVEGGLEINGRIIDLKTLDLPILNIFATQDHLVPPSSSKALRYAVSSEDYTEAPYETGHIGIYVSSKAGGDIPKKIDGWLQERS